MHIRDRNVLFGLACSWSKIPMLQRMGMIGGAKPFPLAFQYSILMIWRLCYLKLASNGKSLKLGCLFFQPFYENKLKISWKMRFGFIHSLIVIFVKFWNQIEKDSFDSVCSIQHCCKYGNCYTMRLGRVSLAHEKWRHSCFIKIHTIKIDFVLDIWLKPDLKRKFWFSVFHTTL